MRAVEALAASLLQIKPIVAVRAGLLEVVGKVRTRRRALEEVVQRIKAGLGSEALHLAVVHARAPQAAAALRTKARQMLRVRELVLTTLSVPVTVHLGPGTVGLVAYPAEE